MDHIDKFFYAPSLYLLPALVTPFQDIAFIIKGNANNGRNPPSCLFPALMTPFPAIAFINEEATGCINEEATGCINEELTGCINEATIGATIAQKNRPSCFFTSCFIVSDAPLINFSRDSTILVI